MRTTILTTVCYSLAVVCLLGLVCQVSQAAPADKAAAGEDRASDEWYYNNGTKQLPDPKIVIRQKAMARGKARAERIAALNWYGMNNSRPTASATPLTGIYSPTWQMPGGRPFAWGYETGNSRPQYNRSYSRPGFFVVR